MVACILRMKEAFTMSRSSSLDHTDHTALKIARIISSATYTGVPGIL